VSYTPVPMNPTLPKQTVDRMRADGTLQPYEVPKGLKKAGEFFEFLRFGDGRIVSVVRSDGWGTVWQTEKDALRILGAS
jgi:hypothetical protein